MFTQEENDLLTQVGPGTPMGELMRRYWVPALLAEELPEPGCAPVRTRLFGEDLVGFRDSQGRVGLLSEYCSHRQASLFYGRTHEDEPGLRCVYHGWKYDVDGRILETPAEPINSQLKDHIRHTAYPCVEVNGLIMTYMGPREKKPLLPTFPWLTLPSDHVSVGSKFLLEANWLQCLEGDNDSIHSAYLHRRGEATGIEARARQSPIRNVEIDVLPWGVRGVTVYPVDESRVFLRTNTFMMPCIGNTPRVQQGFEGGVNPAVHTIYQVPADDYTNWRYDFETFWDQPNDSSYAEGHRREVGPGFKPLLNRYNDYLIDREKQRAGTPWSGVDALNHTQDAVVTETMGTRTGPGSITDRTRENLGATDQHLIAIRRFLLKAMRDHQEGNDPPGVVYDEAENNVHNWVHMVTGVLPIGTSWKGLLPDL